MKKGVHFYLSMIGSEGLFTVTYFRFALKKAL